MPGGLGLGGLDQGSGAFDGAHRLRGDDVRAGRQVEAEFAQPIVADHARHPPLQQLDDVRALHLVRHHCRGGVFLDPAQRQQSWRRPARCWRRSGSAPRRHRPRGARRPRQARAHRAAARQSRRGCRDRRGRACSIGASRVGDLETLIAQRGAHMVALGAQRGADHPAMHDGARRAPRRRRAPRAPAPSAPAPPVDGPGYEQGAPVSHHPAPPSASRAHCRRRVRAAGRRRDARRPCAARRASAAPAPVTRRREHLERRGQHGGEAHRQPGRSRIGGAAGCAAAAIRTAPSPRTRPGRHRHACADASAPCR